MRLVDDQRVVLLELAVAGELGQQDAVGHQLDQRVVGGHIGEPHLVPDGLAERAAELLGDPFGYGPGRKPARLGVADLPGDAPAQLEADLGNLGRLARAGLPRDDHYLVIPDGLGDLIPALADRQFGGIGDGRHGRAARGPGLGAPGLGALISRALISRALISRALISRALISDRERPDRERSDRVVDGSDRAADGSERASAGAASSACDDITDRDSIPAGRISQIAPNHLTLFCPVPFRVLPGRGAATNGWAALPVLSGRAALSLTWPGPPAGQVGDMERELHWSWSKRAERAGQAGRGVWLDGRHE